MEAKDVMNLPWKKVTDWSELSATEYILFGECFVCEADVNIFVENVFRDIARKLNIQYEQLKPILEDENKAFYLLKKRIYNKHDGFGRNHTWLAELKNTLRVPDVSNIENAVTVDTVSACLKQFENLSDTEKIEFLCKIGMYNVKIEHLPVQPEETTVE